jgi:hypothetical protein
MRFVAAAAAAAASAAALAVAPPPPPTYTPPCCAYGGTGAALGLGSGVYSFPGPNGEPTPPILVPFAVSASGSETLTPWVVVLVAAQTGPEDAVVGWHISQNATAQTLSFWTNPPGGTPACEVTSVALPDAFTPGFSLCGGATPSSLFPGLLRNYTLAAETVSVYAQSTGASAAFTGAPGCSLVTISAPKLAAEHGRVRRGVRVGRAGRAPPVGQPARLLQLTDRGCVGVVGGGRSPFAQTRGVKTCGV